MNYILGCDAHKHYSQFAVFEGNQTRCKQMRVEYVRSAIRNFLNGFPEGTPVALEGIENWYRIVDAIERGVGCRALLTHLGKAKVMMGNVNKTDELEARGLTILRRNDTLPTVWITPSEDRDERELSRIRMAGCKIRGWPEELDSRNPGQVQSQPAHPERYIRPKMVQSAEPGDRAVAF